MRLVNEINTRMSKKNKNQIEGIENVEEVLGRTEQFIENNQKTITYVVGFIIIIVLGYFGYNNYIYKPKVAEASASMFQAERYFEQDSMRLALYGDGNNYGFLYILDEYSGTPSANLANYYSGIAFLNIGEYDKAIRHLGSFSSDDIILSTIAQGAIGDALVQKGEIEKGAKQYMKAALNKKDKLNVPVILMKAGIAFEEIGKYDKALIAYKMIQSNYSKSREARMIEKYISKAEVLAKK